VIKLEVLFNYTVTESGCWECSKKDYGERPKLKLAGSGAKTNYMFAAAVVCESKHGPKPGPDYDASHTCDNPVCINPDHLEWEQSESNRIRGSVKGGMAHALKQALKSGKDLRNHNIVHTKNGWQVKIKRKGKVYVYRNVDIDKARAWRDAKRAELGMEPVPLDLVA